MTASLAPWMRQLDDLAPAMSTDDSVLCAGNEVFADDAGNGEQQIEDPVGE
jgi:hypothetical protein